MFSGCLDSAHRRCCYVAYTDYACDDQSGGRCPAQVPQLDTPQASKKFHNSIHNQYEQQKLCQAIKERSQI